MSEKVAVITGASAGIGLAAAKALAAQAWRVIAVGRNPQRCASAEAEIRAVATGDVDMLVCDLAVLAEVKALAVRISGLTEWIDLLANNAGGMASEKLMTVEGLEANFAGNHLGPMLLTCELLPLLKSGASAGLGPARIINTSSDGSEMIPGINLADLQSLENYSPGLAYCTGKLANVLSAKAFAAKWGGDGIIAHAFHPGTVDSNFFAHTPDSVQEAYKDVEKLSMDDGADTLLWLATSEEAAQSNGGYFYQRAPRQPNPVVNDPDVVNACWQQSEKLIAAALAAN